MAYLHFPQAKPKYHLAFHRLERLILTLVGHIKLIFLLFSAIYWTFRDLKIDQFNFCKNSGLLLTKIIHIGLLKDYLYIN